MNDSKPKFRIYFSDYFGVAPKVLTEHGALNVSLVNDLPLFIDPFLLFNSGKPEYQELHENILKYVRFLRDKAKIGQLSAGAMKAWFIFPEVKQTWLGFSEVGNGGTGLGMEFATALHRNMNALFADFGTESVTRSSHLEKLCLIDDGVGRDNISDFTTNLIKEYLLEFTQTFAQKHLSADQCLSVAVPRVSFNYTTETWQSRTFSLPFIDGDYIILTPRDMLTKDDTWINRHDLMADYVDIVDSVPDAQLRAQINNYLASQLPRLPDNKEPSDKDVRAARSSAIAAFPVLLDYFIRYKEDHGERARDVSRERVGESERLFIQGVINFVERLGRETAFYKTDGTTIEEARNRVTFLKDVIENKDGHHLFYGKNGQPVRRERDVHLLFRLTWYATELDVNREVNNGRGPVDFKISRGVRDGTLVEFKLASNSQLEKNLRRQVEIYQRASDAQSALKVIIYFSAQELERVKKILKRLDALGNPNIILIDARKDNKPSASKAK